MVEDFSQRELYIIKSLLGQHINISLGFVSEEEKRLYEKVCKNINNAQRVINNGTNR